ncbi:LPXTG cell wall anchor domain-containing protein [Clostridium gasigenes]|uniref:LPXTG cell wall anchor domain-containing protein n=1 Tax=Clostridium gasigenes TaxID=94869 RepID=UPI0016237A46|nr:LPXTG cell wall anchor domain-containing protein [Clostridium gasigenes]MBB6624398.1 LPXTG cell wall anchor domain-containing protein [Clostridium gasigenes]MBU3088707.1 LPXTG cell wall anchor domain-containing protein [Clostridium gasigenes]MBU3132246.1 LPXTG cell wall anchor domain-containing protein [Clostridium gasigenes]
MVKYKKIFVIAAALLLLVTEKGWARTLAPPNVKLIGNAEGLVNVPGESPFLQGVNMLPGDNITRQMVIENDYDYPYEIFLKAERVTPKEEYDLLEKLHLKINYNDKTIYNGVIIGENLLVDNISLGVINPGENKILIGEVELEGSTIGNEYKNKYGEIKWIFTAVRKETSIKIPYTGDKGILPYVIVAILSLGGIITITIVGRRKKEI